MHIPRHQQCYEHRKIKHCQYKFRWGKYSNMGMKNLAMDIKEDKILVVSFNPGWVKTDMGGSNGKWTPEQSVKTMMKTMTKLKDEDHGTLLQIDGAPIPW